MLVGKNLLFGIGILSSLMLFKNDSGIGWNITGVLGVGRIYLLFILGFKNSLVLFGCIKVVNGFARIVGCWAGFL